MDLPKSNWRYRMRGDPGNWLLDAADNPSVYFWFQRDVVGRPEDAPAMVEAREQILYSMSVQQLFAAQNELGFWESAESLDLPRYRATLWSLALLAELGIPRGSRRANTACEFILQEHVNADGAFTGLRELMYAGLLVRSLLYFKRGDARLAPLLERLTKDAAQGNVYALWALAENRDDAHLAVAREGRERLLDGLARGAFPHCGAFPPFDPQDKLLALRVIALLGGLQDVRAANALEEVWERQREGGRWELETPFSGMLPADVGEHGGPSKWATLDVLRVVARL